MHLAFVWTDNRGMHPLAARYLLEAGRSHEQARAFVAHINRTGGVQGRPVVLRLVRLAPRDGQDYAVHVARACEELAAPPRPVAAVIDFGPSWMRLAECLAEKDIALVSPTAHGFSLARHAALPDHLYAPGWPAPERFARPLAETLRAEGFLRGRVALVHWTGSTAFDAPVRHLRDALRAAGADPHVRGIRQADSETDAGAVLAELRRAVLDLQARGIDRVVTLDANSGSLGSLLMHGAETQGWRPRWALNSTMTPSGIPAELVGSQLRGAVGIGWSPFEDVPGRQIEDTPARATCRSALTAAGLDHFGDRYAANVPMYFCDALLFLRAALERAPALTPAGLRAGTAALGTDYASPLAFSTRFGPDRRDGPDAFRVLRHTDGGLRYEGPLRPLD